MKINKLIINTKSQKYPIFIGRNLISNLTSLTKKNSIHFKKCFLLIDSNVPGKMTKKKKKKIKNKKIYLNKTNYNFT
jgi:3-dehydroquinate synthetase